MTYEIITELVRWVVPSGSWCFLDTSNSVPATKCQLFLLLLPLLPLLLLLLLLLLLTTTITTRLASTTAGQLNFGS